MKIMPYFFWRVLLVISFYVLGEEDDTKYIDTFDSDGSMSQTSGIVCDKKNIQEKENIR